ncbi:PepSY-associated TM helix domain-containing protein [Tenacibaculum pacificus]|uniref:PepSY-associated TM helix domain-containing protein n=1 Tax=Tenacibaculum pacificus TaxID=3018314 RepID=UPI0022F3AFC7|nr:PepSY-associated TM helix domain-containing protein [Tenacibaculum pacificus]WBX73799.1 PepSY-associated TM helix domain-containing protein [Tenacibaculum pacificus]
MKKFNFKNTIRKIHLWIALSSGLIIFIVCITGCIYAFQKEIRLAAYPYYTVKNTAENLQKKPLNNILTIYKEQSDNDVLRIYDFTETDRSTILLSKKEGGYYFSYINPYTGKLLKEKNLNSDFFIIVLYIHQNLLLGQLGAQIIGWSVMLFIISLITGLILWFPKNSKVFKTKKGRKSKFSIKTNAKKQKVVFDSHNVLGFYGASILLILAITGVAWSFTWVDDALYTLVTFESKKEKEKISIDSTKFLKTSLINAKNQLNKNQKNRNLFIYYLPQHDTIPLKITAYPNDDSYGSSDHYYIHPNTGDLIKSKLDKEKNAGEKLHSLYYDIHTGSILGISGKILVFLAGLIGASLPVTGTMLWLHSRKKKRKKRVIIPKKTILKNDTIPMKTKIISLWMLIIFGYIFHHIYGLATVFFNQTVFIDGSTGETPFWAHQWRILMEGTAFLFALLTIQLSKKWFKITSLIWGIIVAIFNCYHVIEEIIGHPDELSKILVLLLTAIASVLLVVNLNEWRKTTFIKQ